MILAAIFVSPNHLGHLFGKKHTGFTINLGGKHLYELSESTKGIKRINKKELNPSYIPGFWDPNIELISAIVGENGIGKTSIMDLLRLPSSYCWYVVEQDDNSSIVENSFAWDVVYYSAFFGQSLYRAEHDNFYDYSKYSLMIDDTEFENLSIGPLLEIHESESLKRLIHFSRFKKAKGILKDIELPIFDKVKLRLNAVTISERQTSYAFRPFFKGIEMKLEMEREEREQKRIDELGLTRKQVRENRTVGNEIRLELHIIRTVMNKVRNILESTGNKYLAEGELRNGFSSSDPLFASQKNSREAFYAFLDHAFIKLRNGQEISIPSNLVKKLINMLISYIPKSEDIENTDEMNLSFDEALRLLNTYEDFLLAFKDDFAYDKKVILQFTPQKKMSSGERGLYDLFAMMLEANKRFQNGLHTSLGDFNKRKIVSDHILLLLDEGDLGFHPEWKKKYLKAIIQMSPILFPGKKIQILITTHDPLTLSDFPTKNVVYLKRQANGNVNNHLDNMRSFGANISTLLKNSFFIRDGLIGDFAKDKIDAIINKLNKWIEIKKNDKKTIIPADELQEVKKLIEIVDEPIIQQKLLEMYGMISDEDEISRRIREMESELKWLKKQKGEQE